MGSIYRWTNKINSMVYIGKTERDAEIRKKEHPRKGRNSLLKDAISEYGIENFKFEVLHDGIIPELLGIYEKQEIEKHNCIDPNGYNKARGSGNGGISKESRLKISENVRKTFAENPEIWRESQRRATEEATKHNTGRNYSKSHRQAISRAKKGVPIKGTIHNKSPLWNSPKDIEEIVRLYTVELKTCSEIGMVYNATNTLIGNILKANGVKLSKTRKPTRSDIWDQQEQVIQLYTSDFRKTQEIADIFKCASSTVLKVLKSNGVEELRTKKSILWDHQDKIISLYTVEMKTIAEIASMFESIH